MKISKVSIERLARKLTGTNNKPKEWDDLWCCCKSIARDSAKEILKNGKRN